MGSGTKATTPLIVHSVIALAKSLHLAVTAEGIETAAQRTALLELGCTLGQGHYFAPALTAAAFERLLPGQPALLARLPAPASLP